jgi:hypothetical protein
MVIASAAICPSVVAHPVDKEANLRLTQLVAVAFFADNFLWQEQGRLPGRKARDKSRRYESQK